MPRCLDPGARFELVLDSDAEKPEGERPTFVFRVLSMREWSEAADQEKPSLAILKAALCDWKNMAGIEFDKERLEDVLDHLEAVELLDALQVSYTDKKKSSSQPTSNADSSAPTAAPAGV
mgnify:CR=1 FL=1